jgi:hypothetical protein
MEELHRQSHDAAAELSRLRERKEHTERNAQAVAEAKAAIATLQQQYTGPTVEQAKAALAEAEERKSAADRRVAELEEQLRKAKEEAMNCRASHAEARADYDAAVNNQEIINQLRERIAGASLDGEPVTELDLRLAEKRVVECRQAVEVGIRTRDAILKAQEAEQHAKRAQGLRRAAEALREAASSVDQVLSTQLPTGPLRAEGGRLVLDTERGQGVPFDECSQGEKYRVALPYGIASVGAGGYLALVQEAWDGLDGEHRAEIAQICKASKVWIITGQVDDGELRAEEFSVQA